MDKVIIDYISDIHIESHIHKRDIPLEEIVYEIVSGRKGEILLIAGDLSEYVNYFQMFLNEVSKYYKEVLVVLGNHDCYIDSKNITLREKIAKIKERLPKNCHLLQNEIFEYKGKKILGITTWYDGSYIDINQNLNYLGSQKVLHREDKKWSIFSHRNGLAEGNFETKEDSDNFKRYLYSIMLRDSNNIEGDFLERAEIANKQILPIVKNNNIDVIFSHINPSPLEKHQSKKYQKDVGTLFFCFDGREILENTNAKYFIFGHTHDKVSYTLNGVKVLNNPYGYHHEVVNLKNKFKIKNIIV